MKQRLTEHVFSILLVGGLILWLIVVVQKKDAPPRPANADVAEEYLSWEFLDFGDPLDRAMFTESANAMGMPGDSLLQRIDDYRREQFTNIRLKTGGEERGLTPARLGQLAGMYLQFILVYVVVMALTYYGAQTIGVMRFIRMKQHDDSSLARLVALYSAVRNGELAFQQAAIAGGRSFLRALFNAVALFVLFSPAYVIAYSIKTEFSTDSLVFMAVLGVVSNGLLIHYANRFFTLLVTESRKGYVETALVKNLHHSYNWNTPQGIARRNVVRLRKQFPAHVFHHIYLSAQNQFHLTLKEHASFLITGLVIIEMALNIQGHLSYEMLKNILYKQYDVVLAIVLGIFVLVKATEITVDLWGAHAARKFGKDDA